MTEIIIAECPNGFSDMTILKVNVNPGGTVEVTPTQFKQMQASNPYVTMSERKLKLNPGKKAEMKGEEVPEFTPIGWYKGQLNKNGGMDGVEA